MHRLVDHLGERFAALGVTGLGQPGFGPLDEHFGTDPGMGSTDDFQQTVHAGSGQGLLVVFQHRLEGLLVFPFGMIRRHALDFVEGEQQLEIRWLLAPQGAVIVEHGNALFSRDKLFRTFGRHLLDEIQHSCTGRCVAPAGQGLGGLQGPVQQQ
ncbi:hypothetical protein D3C77_214600 [compost metagenome]